MKKYRQITVDNDLYYWKVGSSVVDIRTWDRRLFARPSLVEASNGYYANRDFEKRNASITPSMITEFIRQRK